MTDEKTEKEEKEEKEEKQDGDNGVTLSGRSVEAVADALHSKMQTQQPEEKPAPTNSEGTTPVKLSDEDYKGIAGHIHGLQVAEQQEREKQEKEEKEKEEKPERDTKPNPVHFLERSIFKIGGRRASS